MAQDCSGLLYWPVLCPLGLPRKNQPKPLNERPRESGIGGVAMILREEKYDERRSILEEGFLLLYRLPLRVWY